MTVTITNRPIHRVCSSEDQVNEQIHQWQCNCHYCEWTRGQCSVQRFSSCCFQLSSVICIPLNISIGRALPKRRRQECQVVLLSVLKKCPFAAAVKLKLKKSWIEMNAQQVSTLRGCKVKDEKEKECRQREKRHCPVWIHSCPTELYFDTKLLLLINDTSRPKAAWKRRDRAAFAFLSTSLDSFLLLPRFASIHNTGRMCVHSCPLQTYGTEERTVEDSFDGAGTAFISVVQWPKEADRTSQSVGSAFVAITNKHTLMPVIRNSC